MAVGVISLYIFFTLCHLNSNPGPSSHLLKPTFDRQKCNQSHWSGLFKEIKTYF